MKKGLSILSALAIMLSLTACSGDSGNSDNSVQSESLAETQSTVQGENSTAAPDAHTNRKVSAGCLFRAA